MPSLVLDSGPLADFLGQYFTTAQRGHAPFQRGDSLSEDAARTINAITQAFNQEEPARYLVLASTLAFAEVARKWDRLAAGRFAPYQLRAFLAAPPGWFAVDPVDESLVGFFLQVPVAVQMEDGRSENIEWTDAVHVATTLSHDTRQMKCLLAVEDRRIRRVPQLVDRCL